MDKPKGTREKPSQILHCMLCAAGFLDSVLSYQRHLTNISNRKKNWRFFVVIFYIQRFCLAFRCRRIGDNLPGMVYLKQQVLTWEKEMSAKAKRIFLLLIGFAALLTFFVLNGTIPIRTYNEKKVHHDLYYYSVFGNSGIASYGYDEIISEVGSPRKENEYCKGKVIVKDLYYDGFSIAMVSTKEDSNFIVSSVSVTSPEFLLGSENVHVGDTRKEIIRKYHGYNVILERDGKPYPEGEGFVDGIIYVEFEYNNSDCVEKIRFGIGP